MSARARHLAAVATTALVLAAVPTVAVFLGSPGTRTVRLNLGPGDAPYISGFTPAWEIEAGVATHWTTYEAAVHLPLEVRGGLAVARYRFSRVLAASLAMGAACLTGAAARRCETGCKSGARGGSRRRLVA